MDLWAKFEHFTYKSHSLGQAPVDSFGLACVLRKPKLQLWGQARLEQHKLLCLNAIKMYSVYISWVIDGQPSMSTIPGLTSSQKMKEH